MLSHKPNQKFRPILEAIIKKSIFFFLLTLYGQLILIPLFNIIKKNKKTIKPQAPGILYVHESFGALKRKSWRKAETLCK